MRTVSARMRRQCDVLWERLAQAIPELALNGHRSMRLPNTFNLRFPRATGDAILAVAPEVAASTGSACHEGHESASAVIVAMGVAPEDALGSVRITLGRGTTDDDVIRAADVLVYSWKAVWRAEQATSVAAAARTRTS